MKELEIAEIVYNLVRCFNKHPFEINQGSCEKFASQLSKILKKKGYGDSQVIWVDQVNSKLTINHACLFFEGKFYDSEEPFGVEDVCHLPLCARQIRFLSIRLDN